MSSLKSCLIKSGKAFNKAETDQLILATKKNIKAGDNSIVAATKAIEQLVRTAHQSVTDYEKEIEAKGGDTKSSDFDLDKEIAFAMGNYSIEGISIESKIDKLITKRGGPVPVKSELELVEQSMLSEEYTPRQAAAVKKGGFGKQTTGEKIKAKINRIKENAQTKFRQSIVDQFASFKEILKDERSWMLGHLTNSSTGAIEATINIGQPYLHSSGVIKVDVGKKSLSQVLEPLGDNLDKWTYWMAGNRSNRLIGEGKEHLFDQEEIDALMSMNEGNETLFEKVRQDFEDLNNAVVQISVDTGLVNAEEAAIWRDEGFYLPFYRVLEDEKGTHGPRALARGGLARQQAYRKLKGGKEQLSDLMTNVLLNWNHLISASLKNQAATAALDAADKLEMVHEVNVKNKSTDAIFIRKDGEEVWYEVDEPLVLASLNALNWSGLNNTFMKVGRAFKKALTIGVTASPDFKIRNLLRDSIHAMAVTGTSANIAKNLYQGWNATRQGSDAANQMLAGGGSFGESGFIHGNDPDAIKRLVKTGLSEQDAKTSILDAPNKFKLVWDKYQAFGSRLENINRAADYVQALERGEDLLKATFNARDHLDFSRTGTSTTVRAIAQLVPFINARLQGIDKMARAAPGTFKEWMDPKEATKFKMVIGLYSALSVTMYLAMKDDDDYKALEEWEKRTYHHFKVPGSETMYRIPRPFEVGAIAYMAESVAQQMADDKVHGVLFAERLRETLLDTFAMNPMPQIFKPGLEVAMNKNLFTGRPIESISMANLSPENRKRAWTSETAVAMAQGLSKVPWDKVQLSPVQIQHLVRGYLGWMGATSLAATDMLITRPLTDAPSAPMVKFSEYPIIKVFIKSEPSKNTHYTSMFYDRLKDINRAYADISAAKKMGDWEETAKVLVEKKGLLEQRKFYTKASKQLSKINQRLKLVRLSSMNSADKRAEMDRLTYIKNSLTKIVFDLRHD